MARYLHRCRQQLHLKQWASSTISYSACRAALRGGPFFLNLRDMPLLARNSHPISPAAAHPCMSAAMRSLGFLDVLSSAPAGPSVARRKAKRRIHAHLHGLATKPGEKCGSTVTACLIGASIRLFCPGRDPVSCHPWPESQTCNWDPDPLPFPWALAIEVSSRRGPGRLGKQCFGS